MSSDVLALSTASVTASYGKGPVIRDISLDIRQGETFGLMGLNGAGKTTLIKAILGLRDQDSGTIMIGGHDRLDRRSKEKIAYLPERFDPPWFLSGMEFLRFSLELYAAPFDEKAVRDAAASLALDPDVLRNRVQTYSKGMRQKLGILGTVLTGCPLLILDEPMSGLDPRARARVKDVLLLARSEGRTIFLSSHILSDMNEICDRVAVLHNAVLPFVGTPEHLRQFAGTDNLERAFLHVIEKNDAA